MLGNTDFSIHLDPFKVKSKSVLVLICGAGYQNYGDDVILSKWLHNYPGWDVVLVSGDSIEQHPTASIIKHFSLTGICHETLNEIQEILRCYSKSVIHLTGGGFCNDEFQTSQKIFELIDGLQKTSIVVGTGLSLYPLSEASILLLNLIKFRYVSFRDKYSRMTYKGLCSPICGDDLLPVLQYRADCNHSKKLFINIQNQFKLVGNLPTVAKKIKRIVSQGNFTSVVLCELHPGDLDIKDFLDVNQLEICNRDAVYSGFLMPSKDDFFITSRFHFRMLMENSGARGIVIVANDYYANKHEVNCHSPINFVKGRSFVFDVAEFKKNDLHFPERKKGWNYNIIAKKLESILIRFFAKLGLLF